MKAKKQKNSINGFIVLMSAASTSVLLNHSALALTNSNFNSFKQINAHTRSADSTAPNRLLAQSVPGNTSGATGVTPSGGVVQPGTTIIPSSDVNVPGGTTVNSPSNLNVPPGTAITPNSPVTIPQGTTVVTPNAAVTYPPGTTVGPSSGAVIPSGTTIVPSAGVTNSGTTTQQNSGGVNSGTTTQQNSGGVVNPGTTTQQNSGGVVNPGTTTQQNSGSVATPSSSRVNSGVTTPSRTRRNGLRSSGNASSTGQQSVFRRYMLTGYAATKQRDYQTALVNFRKALNERPGNPYATKAIRTM